MTGLAAAAAGRISALDDSEAADWARRCEPTFKRIQASQTAAVDRVADHMKGQAYTDHVDRAMPLDDEQAAQRRPRGPEGEVDSRDDRDDRRRRLRDFEK